MILIEFDHQRPVNLPGAGGGQATQAHVHSVVRTPNGNRHGKDLLRQHYERHPAPQRHRTGGARPGWRARGQIGEGADGPAKRRRDHRPAPSAGPSTEGTGP